MAELSTRSVQVFFPIVLMTLIAPTGRCLDLFELDTNERNLTSGGEVEQDVKNITWVVNGNSTGVRYNIENSTELVKVNDTDEWPSRNKTLSDKVTDIGKKVRGFFEGLTSGLFGGSRKKRSAGVHDNLYMGRNAKMWQSFLGDMHGYGRRGSTGFERPNMDNIRWPASHGWYNWQRMGNEDGTAEKNGFSSPKDARHPPANYETFTPPAIATGYETLPQPPKVPVKARNRYLLRAQQTYDPSMHSVKIFKQMKNDLMVKKRKRVEAGRAELVQPDIPDVMEIHTENQNHPGPQSQYRCKAGTKGVLPYQEGRTLISKGLTYSQEDNRGIRTLVCKAETSDVFQPDPDTYQRNSVTGINIITSDNDPFKMLDKGNEIDNEALELGSHSGSELSYLSEKNQSVSSVSTQGRGAHAQTKANTKYVYENGDRTAFDSEADVEGSTTFNATETGNVPLMVTSRKKESSSIMQNPENLGVPTAEDEGVATFMDYKKKVDFDIAFRNFFD